MLKRAKISLEKGKVLYNERSTLPVDFYNCCEKHFHIIQKKKTFIGVRSSQQRGLFLDPSETPVKANEEIAVIPLTSLYRTSNIHTKPNVLPHVRVEDVRQAIKINEFKIMAPQIYLGLQFSSIISQLPDITRQRGPEEVQLSVEVLQGGANPWARMLDDEDFNEDFVLSMYGMSLDHWQRNSFDDITKQFNLSMNDVLEAIQPPFKSEHFRRITRLVLARAEHVPPADYYEGNATLRRARRRLRQFLGRRDPSDLAMVPYLDMINHSNRPNIGLRVGPSPTLGGRGAITLHSLSPIEPGSELCRHYNFAISRPYALFRYGFLPFDIISIVEQDAVDEHLLKNRHMLKDETDEVIEARRKIEAEVDKLEAIFKKARSSKKD